jgi:hypothetical protein
MLLRNRSGRLRLNRNGRLHHNRNGRLHHNRNGRLHRNRSGRLHHNHNGRLHLNRSGRLHRRGKPLRKSRRSIRRSSIPRRIETRFRGHQVKMRSITPPSARG